MLGIDKIMCTLKQDGYFELCEQSFLPKGSLLGWWCEQRSVRPLGNRVCYDGNFKTLRDVRAALSKHVEKVVDNPDFSVVDCGLLMHAEDMDPMDTGLALYFGDAPWDSRRTSAAGRTTVMSKSS